jgi:hypothetical protein
MMESPGLLLVTGIFTMGGGAAMVVGHNVWSGGALPVAVTLLGWLTLIKGVALMAVPPRALTSFYRTLHYPVADGEHQIPSDRPQDHLGGELTPRELFAPNHRTHTHLIQRDNTMAGSARKLCNRAIQTVCRGSIARP